LIQVKRVSHYYSSNLFSARKGTFDLAPVDKLVIQILIDDVSDLLSTVPIFAESEFGYLFRTGKMPIVEAKYLCCAVHGSCSLVTALSWLAGARDAIRLPSSIGQSLNAGRPRPSPQR
jgi:hypothetical protein